MEFKHIERFKTHCLQSYVLLSAKYFMPNEFQFNEIFKMICYN